AAFMDFRDSLGFHTWRLSYDLVVLLVVLGAAVVMGLVAWGLAGRLTRPLEILAEAVRRVANGDRRPPQLSSAATSEVAALNEDFLAMTAALRSADDDLRLRSAALAHDIRTPLTILRGRLAGLKEGLFTADDAFCDGLVEQIGWIDLLVSDVNALADARQAGTGKRERVDLGALAKDSVDSLRPELEAGGVSLTLDSGEGVHVEADPGRLRRALLNILRNLIRYAPEAPATIEVFADGADAVLRCTDHGPGWPPGDPRALAEPFTRGEGSRSRQTGGSGLGLSIVQATVAAYGGVLNLRRGAEGGAIVEIRLPLLR
ncbi:MAG: sensor histidine kinase, partial [Phenylobacterium sp.]